MFQTESEHAILWRRSVPSLRAGRDPGSFIFGLFVSRHIDNLLRLSRIVFVVRLCSHYLRKGVDNVRSLMRLLLAKIAHLIRQINKRRSAVEKQSRPSPHCIFRACSIPVLSGIYPSGGRSPFPCQPLASISARAWPLRVVMHPPPSTRSDHREKKTRMGVDENNKSNDKKKVVKAVRFQVVPRIHHPMAIGLRPLAQPFRPVYDPFTTKSNPFGRQELPLLSLPFHSPCFFYFPSRPEPIRFWFAHLKLDRRWDAECESLADTIAWAPSASVAFPAHLLTETHRKDELKGKKKDKKRVKMKWEAGGTVTGNARSRI